MAGKQEEGSGVGKQNSESQLLWRPTVHFGGHFARASEKPKHRWVLRENSSLHLNTERSAIQNSWLGMLQRVRKDCNGVNTKASAFLLKSSQEKCRS